MAERERERESLNSTLVILTKIQHWLQKALCSGLCFILVYFTTFFTFYTHKKREMCAAIAFTFLSNKYCILKQHVKTSSSPVCYIVGVLFYSVDMFHFHKAEHHFMMVS